MGSQRNPEPSGDRQDCCEQTEPGARPWHGTAGEGADNKAKLRTTWSSCVFQGVLLSHAQYCDILKYLASGVHHKYLETLNDNSGELAHVANTLDVIVH